jgi:hypothetical protein
MGSLNKGRILDDTTGELWEGFAERGDTLRLHFEATFLGHSGVPTEWGYISERCWDTLPRDKHIICRAENGVDEHIAASSETVGGWIVRGHVNDRVDIRLFEGIQQMTIGKRGV